MQQVSCSFFFFGSQKNKRLKRLGPAGLSKRLTEQEDDGETLSLAYNIVPRICSHLYPQLRAQLCCCVTVLRPTGVGARTVQTPKPHASSQSCCECRPQTATDPKLQVPSSLATNQPCGAKNSYMHSTIANLSNYLGSDLFYPSTCTGTEKLPSRPDDEPAVHKSEQLK